MKSVEESLLTEAPYKNIEHLQSKISVDQQNPTGLRKDHSFDWQKNESTIETPSEPQVSLSSAHNTFHWAGYEWISSTLQNSAPGPNNYDSNNVWVDADNKLHLIIRYSNITGRWTCAELGTKVKFGFGTFRWYLEGAIDKFDPNVVLGLFTYGGVDYINEIDIELTKWGAPSSKAPNLWYTVYPSTLGIDPERSNKGTPIQGPYTTHQFTWTSSYVALQSQYGFINSSTENITYLYETPATFASAVPYTSAPLCMNLWLMLGRPPMNVHFYKRAETLVSDIWRCFNGHGLGHFAAMDGLTMIADYHVPQVLSHEGILIYS
ncbi:unnamed protein product [Rotaria sp. Silwood1]|nr:unnamed protein product [Rotaria sp. Silwood1]